MGIRIAVPSATHRRTSVGGAWTGASGRASAAAAPLGPGTPGRNASTVVAHITTATAPSRHSRALRRADDMPETYRSSSWTCHNWAAITTERHG